MGGGRLCGQWKEMVHNSFSIGNDDLDPLQLTDNSHKMAGLNVTSV